MIKVSIKKIEGRIELLEVKGHANSAPKGKDLICAAVSAVITGGFNALQNVENYHISLKEGYASLEACQPLSSHDEIVVETIIVGLKTIAEGNEDFVSIKNL